MTHVDGADRVLGGDELEPSTLDVALGASDYRQDQRLLAGHDMRAVEFGGHLDCQFRLADSSFGASTVGDCGNHVARHADHDLHVPAFHGVDAVDRVEAVVAGRVETKFASQCIEEIVGHLFPDAHRAVTLDVAVSPHW